MVGPVDWWGIETIALTIQDPKGGESTSELTVYVEEAQDPFEERGESTRRPGEDELFEDGGGEPEEEPSEEAERETPCGGVVFTTTQPGAQLVELGSTLNNWQPEPMDNTAEGLWVLEKEASPGSVIEYKFVVDGIWMEDAANPDLVNDGFGGFNSVLTVPLARTIQEAL